MLGQMPQHRAELFGLEKPRPHPRTGRMVRLKLGEWGQRGLRVRQARKLAAEVRQRVRTGEEVEALRRELKQRRADSK
jgi:hypothetical protein